MALNHKPPDPINCFDEPRHRNQPRPEAVALVRWNGGHALSGRCGSCLRTLEAVAASAALVDVFDLPNPRQRGTTTDHDDDITGAAV